MKSEEVEVKQKVMLYTCSCGRSSYHKFDVEACERSHVYAKCEHIFGPHSIEINRGSYEGDETIKIISWCTKCSMYKEVIVPHTDTEFVNQLAVLVENYKPEIGEPDAESNS